MALDWDRFISDCVAAVADSTPQRAIRETLARAVSDPNAILHALGSPSRAEVQRLYNSSELTILNVVWAPRMTLLPHNHNMWAVIGVYCGCEDNRFWRRIPGEPRGRIEAAGANSLAAREAHPFGPDIIHSVTNPTEQFTGAIHVYGGDFFAVERSEWEPETLQERPYDVARNLDLFVKANAIGAAAR